MHSPDCRKSLTGGVGRCSCGSDEITDLRRQLAAMTERAEKAEADAADLRRECRAAREWHVRGGEDPVTSEMTYKAWTDSMKATDASGALARGDGEKT